MFLSPRARTQPFDLIFHPAHCAKGNMAAVSICSPFLLTQGNKDGVLIRTHTPITYEVFNAPAHLFSNQSYSNTPCANLAKMFLAVPKIERQQFVLDFKLQKWNAVIYTGEKYFS